MRKLIVTALMASVAAAAQAQDLKSVQTPLQAGNFQEARTQIDKLSSDPKAQNNSEYWFLRAQVYSGLAKQPTDTATAREALRSIDRYYALEANVKDENKRMMRAMLENHKTAVDQYSNAFNAGIQSFNNKDWTTAEASFSRALDAFQLLQKNKLITQPFDTTSTLYAGYAAQNAKNTAGAARYYAQIAERKIADTTMIGVYEFLASYYQQNNDEANMRKYLALGKELFPKNNTWLALELSGLDKDMPKKLARMAELVKQNPDNLDLAQDYTAELFNFIYGKDKPTDYTARQQELDAALRAMISKDPNSAYAQYVMTQHLSNQIYDLQQSRSAIKGTKPEDMKKRGEMDKQILAKFEEMFPFASKSVAIYEGMGSNLKPVDKANFRNALNNLADYYSVKKNPTESKKYEERAKAVH